MRLNRTYLIVVLAILVVSLLGSLSAFVQPKSNIVVIWGDDIGRFNVSAYNLRMTG